MISGSKIGFSNEKEIWEKWDREHKSKKEKK